MNIGKSIMQGDLFSNVRINIITSAHTHCNETWKDIDYLPDYNKFYLIEDGEGWLKIGDEEYYPKSGQLFLMPAGIIQSYSCINSNTFIKYWCHFTLKIGDANFFDVLDVPYYANMEHFANVKELFQRLIYEHNNNTLCGCLREKAILLEIVAYYLQAAKFTELKFVHTSSLDKFNKTISYIQDHIHEELSTGDLAEKLHYNPNYFTRLFKKYTGMTPTEYIKKTRLDKAKLLLRTTELQITEIATETGFCDVCYFSRSFKSYTGFSPTDYRLI